MKNFNLKHLENQRKQNGIYAEKTTAENIKNTQKLLAVLFPNEKIHYQGQPLPEKIATAFGERLQLLQRPDLLPILYSLPTAPENPQIEQKLADDLKIPIQNELTSNPSFSLPTEEIGLKKAFIYYLLAYNSLNPETQPIERIRRNVDQVP